MRRIQIEPGKRSTPAHTHSGEEEMFYVLAGSGLSWQAGAAYQVEAGDCIVHLVEGPAHTLIGGPDGLDVLVFGERTASESCFLPRAKVAWLGASWVRAGEGDHPFAQEAAAGVVSVPAGIGIAHAFRAGPDGLTLLAYGNRDPDDIIWYPRSQKVAFSGVGIVGRFERAGYWDGEE